MFGFADCFLKVMKMKDGVTDPVRYGKTFTLTHDPPSGARQATICSKKPTSRCCFIPPWSTC